MGRESRFIQLLPARLVLYCTTKLLLNMPFRFSSGYPAHNCKASVGGTFELTGEAPHEIEFIGEATGELRAVGELDVLGRTVAGASAYVRTALAFDNGGTSNNPRKAKLVVGEGKVEVEGMLRSRGVILTASVKYPTSSQATEIDPITLFGPKTFCTFPHG